MTREISRNINNHLSQYVKSLVVQSSQETSEKDKVDVRTSTPQLMLRRSREIPGTVLMSIESFKEISRGFYLPKNPERQI